MMPKLFGWICALLVASITVFVAVWLVCGHGVSQPALAGLALAAINSMVALVLSLKSIGGTTSRFMLYGVLGNGLRLLILLGLAAIYRFAVGGDDFSFNIALASGYVIFMIYEVAVLNAMGLGRKDAKG